MAKANVQTPVTPATPSTSKPPKTLEEFISLSNIDDWPRPLEQSEFNLQLSPDQIINRNSIVTKLLQAAPLSLAGFGMIRKNIDNLHSQVTELSGHFLAEKALVPVPEMKKPFFAPPETFLTEIAESEIVQSLAGVKKSAKAAQSGNAGEEATEEEERCTNVLKAGFPGIRPDAATDLPNWIELPAIVEKVAQTVDVQSNMRAMWRQIYLSQASIVLIQDGFWFLFLDYFKQSTRKWPLYKMKDDDVVAAKDKLFDRMSDTYVTLFFSVDRSVRDKFFKDFSTIVAQSIFLCFADAFPDSQYLYDDAFKAYLANCVTLWFQGVKANPDAFKKWAVSSMLKADQIEAERKQRQANMVFDPATLDAAIAQLPPVSLITGRKSVRMSVTPTAYPIVPQLSLSRQPSQPASSSGLPSAVPPKLTAKSATSAAIVPAPIPPPKKRESLPIGRNLMIERVKFRLAGNSQLLDHHMRMHGIPIVTGPMAVRSQEVPFAPNTNQTYAELIEESKKAMKDFEDHMNELEKETLDEINRVRKMYIAGCRERRENKDLQKLEKRAGRAMDVARAAANEVREMMKHAIKSDRSHRFDDDELATNLALGL